MITFTSTYLLYFTTLYSRPVGDGWRDQQPADLHGGWWQQVDGSQDRLRLLMLLLNLMLMLTLIVMLVLVMMYTADGGSTWIAVKTVSGCRQRC